MSTRCLIKNRNTFLFILFGLRHNSSTNLVMRSSMLQQGVFYKIRDRFWMVPSSRRFAFRVSSLLWFPNTRQWESKATRMGIRRGAGSFRKWFPHFTNPHIPSSYWIYPCPHYPFWKRPTFAYIGTTIFKRIRRK